MINIWYKHTIHCTLYINQLYLFSTAEVFQQKEPSSSPLGNVGKENTDVSNHYMPSRGICVEKCIYVSV